MGKCDASPSTGASSDFRSFLKLLISGQCNGQLLRIQLSVLSTVVLLALLLFLGSIRRPVRLGWLLKYATKIIYLMIPISITYIMGLMHNASCTHPLFPIWACVLIYAYGGVITMSACDLRDNDDTLQYFWRILPLFFWTVWLGIIVVLNDKRLLAQCVGVIQCSLIVAWSNTTETLIAFYRASKSKGLPRVVEPIVRYMHEGKDMPDEAIANPVSMGGYRYVVWGCPNRDNIVTTEEIWQSVGVSFLANCEGKDCLMRDLTLSYAFFRLILRRFAGFPLHESSTAQRRQSTMRFMSEGLLSLEPQQVERLFHMIEAELHFLFDFFYTKSHIWNSYRYGGTRILWNSFAVCYYVLVVYLIQYDQVSGITYHGHHLELGVTRAVMIIFLLLELWKHIKVHYSNRKMVWLLCIGVREIEAERRKVIEKKINRIWTRKARLSRMAVLRFFSKPWQRRLGQYSFLESYGRVPILARKPFSRWGKLVKLPRCGQVGDTSVALSKEVKQAIVSSLLRNELAMSRGTATIARHELQLHEDIVNACELDSEAQVILVWHIATSFCESDHAPKDDDPNFLVATQLSKYCAYLVTFVPELLPDHPYTAEHLFDMAVEEAKRELVGANMPEGNPNVIDIDVTPNEVVTRGYMLAQTLKRLVLIPNPNRGWEFLAEFWAELLLYLAPSDNVAAHGEHLANGGEFITHLWALLTHAGVVSRN